METKGTDLKPDKGFDYNVGREAWGPDLSKYPDEARSRLKSEGVGPPKSIPDLAVRLERIKEGYRQTGIPTSSANITIKRDPSMSLRGRSNYRTGEIDLNNSSWSEIREALEKGRIENLDGMDAFMTLTHEFGYQLGFPIDPGMYLDDEAYQAVTETVNEMWSLYAIDDVLKSLNVGYEPGMMEDLADFRTSAYGFFVDRTRTILEAADFEEEDIRSLVARLNTNVPTEDFSDEIWTEIVQRKPGLEKTEEFGNVITNERRFRALLARLTN